MGDGQTAFNNFIYYTVAGFSEYDNFRSNQIREGLISRDEAIRLAEEDNKFKYNTLKNFSEIKKKFISCTGNQFTLITTKKKRDLQEDRPS